MQIKQFGNNKHYSALPVGNLNAGHKPDVTGLWRAFFGNKHEIFLLFPADSRSGHRDGL
jgi:hypothetical protein